MERTCFERGVVTNKLDDDDDVHTHESSKLFYINDNV